MQNTAALAPSPPVLDPVENISVNLGADYAPGKYRRDYLGAAFEPDAWGNKWNGCGKLTLCRVALGVATYLPVLCDTWACAVCGPRRAAWLKRELAESIERYALRCFWTLTIWTATCTPAESFARVTKAWNIIRRNLGRDYGRFEFVWTVEATKRGYAHLHILTDCLASRKDLSRRWEAATDGSFVVKVQSAYSAGAANYLAKYCVQQATMRQLPEWGALKGKRAFSKSSGVKFSPFRPTKPEGGEPSEWFIIPSAYWDVVEAAKDRYPVISEARSGVPCLVVDKEGMVNEPRRTNRLDRLSAAYERMGIRGS